ncbi:MAG TPA: DNA primase [Thermoplasmatales archaeon]|nr:DNA primase [Thermoplasmatales archaeon]
MVLDPATTKYMIRATIKADGIIEKSDVVGAIFGQTEGLLGDELDLRELQRSARVGRIEVELESKNGKSQGTITLPTSLDKVETVILAAAFESIDRVGPCKAKIVTEQVEDVRVARRKQIIERAKELLNQVIEESKMESGSIADTVRQAVQVEEITTYGPDRCPAGPNVDKSDSLIIVEGRRDVLNLLKYGIKNVIAVGGTNIPKTVIDLSKEKITTAFVDGDRGGELILRELLQTADIDFVARAPPTREVEELPQKLIMKALKNKIPAEQYAEMLNIEMPRDREKPEDYHRITTPVERDHHKTSSSDKTKSDTSGKERNYFSILDEVAGSLKAVLLDAKDKELKKVPVRELTEELKKSKDVQTVVFDGIVTQRLIDIAHTRNIKNIVGIKIGNVIKKPKDVRIITRKSS